MVSTQYFMLLVPSGAGVALNFKHAHPRSTNADAKGRKCPAPPRVISTAKGHGHRHGCPQPPLAPLPDHLDLDHLEYSVSIKHEENVGKVRMVLSEAEEKSSIHDRMRTVDCLKRLCIDHHFSKQVDSTVAAACSLLHDTSMDDYDLFNATLFLRLLREAGYHHDVVSSDDVLQRFIDDTTGEFKIGLRKDIRGLLSLHDVSHINTGTEKLLYKAREFSTKHLTSSTDYLNPNVATYVRQSIDHPYHVSLRQYKARHHLNFLQSLTSCNTNLALIQELALTEYQLNKLLHQKELQQVTRWWMDLGLAQDLPVARDQIMKWYVWSMTALQGPSHSTHRVELTKLISFVYIVDDIFDLVGTIDDLSLFANAVNKWDISTIDSLPNYMRSCYMGLYTSTNDLALLAEKQHGYNPIYYLKKAWGMLLDGFMEEAKWFAARDVPATDDYLRNGAITSGVPLVLLHVLFLLGGKGIQSATKLLRSQHNNNIPAAILSPAKILRLSDDLGSAQDEAQEGLDGSYKVCYLKENPECTDDDAKQHIMRMIHGEWEELNRECFFGNSFSSGFLEASLNCARMVSVMYGYDQDQNLPVLHDYVQQLLF